MTHAIDTTELARLLDEGGVALIDVREVDEFARGHVPGAVNIPMSVLPVRVADVPADREVHLICHTGGRSAQVAAWLEPQGYQPINVSGGTLAWAQAGRPLEA